MSETLGQIKDLIVKKLAIDAKILSDEKPMLEFGMDSLSQIELLFEIEEYFNIRIPEDKYQMKTLLDLARIVDEIKLIPKQEKNQQATTVSEHRNAEVDSIE